MQGRIVRPAQAPRVVTVARRRRPFGLDAPRPPDVERLETAIRAWLGVHIPDALPLRMDTGVAPGTATLVLLLPAGRTAVLRIETASAAARPDAAALAEACRARRIPLARVVSLEEARSALRRLGYEPAEHR